MRLLRFLRSNTCLALRFSHSSPRTLTPLEAKALCDSLSDESRLLLSSEIAKRTVSNRTDGNTNNNEIVSKDEFVTWWFRHQRQPLQSHPLDTSTPSKRQLLLLSVNSGLPYIGFGFLDNFIMIIAGEHIDLSLGLAFGLSTMAAAGLGNTISDVAGISVGKYIEGALDKLGLPDAKLSKEQLTSSVVQWVKFISSVIGITFGCLLGMLPLLFTGKKSDEGLVHTMKRSEHDQSPSPQKF